MPRARELGIPFLGQPGVFNAITDVPGVAVGYTTIRSSRTDDCKLTAGASESAATQESPLTVHTGVTAIFPRGRDNPVLPVAAGFFSLNGNGEMTGSVWVEETGSLASPIVLSNTYAVGTCHRGVVDWINTHFPSAGWVLPCVAETWDGYLNDINGAHVTPQAVFDALDSAQSGVPLEEGSVGGGTGMNTYGYKAGSGTSSRQVPHGSKTYHVGVFVQSNFGRRSEMLIGGCPVGQMLSEDNPMADIYLSKQELPTMQLPSGAKLPCPPGSIEGAGSIIAIVATDAPLLPGQCKALARRVSMGIARTGTTSGHFSGDIFLAFSTANSGALTSDFSSIVGEDTDYETLQFIPWGHMDKFYAATAYATEEAIINSMTMSGETIGIHGHRTPGIPVEKVVQILTERLIIPTSKDP
jgi:D-aminopeptidase